MQKEYHIHMEYSPGTSWLSQSHASGVHDGRAPAGNGWAKDPSTGASGAGPSGVQPSMDMNEFAMDLSGEQIVQLSCIQQN